MATPKKRTRRKLTQEKVDAINRKAGVDDGPSHEATIGNLPTRGVALDDGGRATSKDMRGYLPTVRGRE